MHSAFVNSIESLYNKSRKSRVSVDRGIARSSLTIKPILKKNKTHTVIRTHTLIHLMNNPLHYHNLYHVHVLSSFDFVYAISLVNANIMKGARMSVKLHSA